jgi:hypothetical protein
MGVRKETGMKLFLLLPIFIACNDGCGSDEKDTASAESSEPAEDSAE